VPGETAGAAGAVLRAVGLEVRASVGQHGGVRAADQAPEVADRRVVFAEVDVEPLVRSERRGAAVDADIHRAGAVTSGGEAEGPEGEGKGDEFAHARHGR